MSTEDDTLFSDDIDTGRFTLDGPNAFPIITAERERGRAYLDSAATTQKPKSVITAMERFLSLEYANTHRGSYPLSDLSTRRFEESRHAVGRFINASDPEREIIFTGGTTESINLVARSWADENIEADDEIVLTTMEHHSNLIPWQLLCHRTGARLVEVRPDAQGMIPLDRLRKALSPRTRLVGMVHISNLLGTLNPVAEAARIAHEAGALFLVDGAQALGHVPVDVRAIDCDLYAGSGHKMFGPSGSGFLYGKAELLDAFPPFMGGGHMIQDVGFHESTYADIPARLEAGTVHIEATVGLCAAIEFLEAIGMEAIREHDRAITDFALAEFARRPFLEVYGPSDAEHRGGLVAFNLKDIHAHDVDTLLGAGGVDVRSGHLCAQPILCHLGKRSCVRASFAVYNNLDDIRLLMHALDEAARCFGVT